MADVHRVEGAAQVGIAQADADGADFGLLVAHETGGRLWIAGTDSPDQGVKVRFLRRARGRWLVRHHLVPTSSAS
jgi:hypothetical protein